MVRGDAVPRVKASVPLRDAILEMTEKRLGCTSVVREDGTLEGILTDGDLRRLLTHQRDIGSITAGMAMTKGPKRIREGTQAVVALQEMESYNITQIIVVDQKDRVVGVVHLHDLVKAGLGGDEPA
jgi:arabinose-5-phosphate isomerase